MANVGPCDDAVDHDDQRIGVKSVFTQVSIVPLGPVDERLHFPDLVEQLNGCQEVYRFEIDDPLRNLPIPSRAPTGAGNLSPQYDPDDLFAYLNEHRAKGRDQILIGVIDSEIFDELFSTTDRGNTMVLVSMRVPELPSVLRTSGKTYEQYVALEIGAQLIALQYRRRAGIAADPIICEKPWHIDRRNCLFDYFGLDEVNVQKLISPKISDQVIADFRVVELPQTQIDASVSIVESASSTLWSEVWRQLPKDPSVTLALGAIIGLAASIASSLDGRIWYVFVGIALTAIVARVYNLKRS